MSDPDRARALAEYANADAVMQPMRPPGGHSTRTMEVSVVGARQVAVRRDEAQVRQAIAAEAAAAADHWYYRFPVRSKEGKDHIDGPTIKLANAVLRLYRNSTVELKDIEDRGDSWMITARFTDYENGFSMERAYQQRKSQTSLKTKDYDRQQDIAFQIGQSKAIRNVIVNALGTFCDYAEEQARKSLVDKIGKDLPGWRQGVIEGLARIPCDVRRVERVVGRAAKDWLAPDISFVLAAMKAISEGMASLDDRFPPIEASPAEKPKTETIPGSPEPTADQRS